MFNIQSYYQDRIEEYFTQTQRIPNPYKYTASTLADIEYICSNNKYEWLNGSEMKYNLKSKQTMLRGIMCHNFVIKEILRLPTDILSPKKRWLIEENGIMQEFITSAHVDSILLPNTEQQRIFELKTMLYSSKKYIEETIPRTYFQVLVGSFHFNIKPYSIMYINTNLEVLGVVNDSFINADFDFIEERIPELIIENRTRHIKCNCKGTWKEKNCGLRWKCGGNENVVQTTSKFRRS